jgi:hypothetical protein
MVKSTRKIDSNSQSVGEVLRKPLFYRVPAYQRDFAWSSEEVVELWDDITRALLEGRSEYFLGAMVTSHGDDDKTRDIVDGQQRLTVVSMMFSAIAQVWRENQDERRASAVTRDYLGSEDRRTGDVVPKLRLNETNDNVYQDTVLLGRRSTEQERKTWQHTNKLLAGAYEELLSKVREWAQNGDDLDTALMDLEEFVSGQTNLILIEAGDESDAFIIFETLNDRGLELAVADLVKNYLFSLAGQSHIEKFKRSWAEIALLVGSENLSTFLRHYWLSEKAVVRERDLYRALRASAKSGLAARQLMDRLRRAADYYAALSNPEHTYWNDFPVEARSYLDALLLFKVTQFRPLLLTAMEKGAPDLVTRLLRVVTVISFRYTVISSLGTGNLESIYSNAAVKVRNGEASTASEIFQLLKAVYVDDTRFAGDFRQKRFSKSAQTRYVLAELNDYLEQDAEKTVDATSARITLEHILPRNPSKAWEDAIPSGTSVIDYVERIGNLTLLEKGRNRELSNMGFDEKRAILEQSSLRLNKQVAEAHTWTHREIEQRSASLAKAAKHIWRVEF